MFEFNPKTLLNHIRTAIIVSELAGDVIFINDGFTLDFGYTTDDIKSTDEFKRKALKTGADQHEMIKIWGTDFL